MKETKTAPNRYRIMNRVTKEWWEGEAPSDQEACQLDKDELKRIHRYLPKWVQQQVREVNMAHHKGAT